jgi:hypothetical protein
VILLVTAQPGPAASNTINTSGTTRTHLTQRNSMLISTPNAKGTALKRVGDTPAEGKAAEFQQRNTENPRIIGLCA